MRVSESAFPFRYRPRNEQAQRHIMRSLSLNQIFRLRLQYELRENLLGSSHTYDLVVYVSVIHLKCHVEFKIVPHYSSNDICGHVISMVD